MIVFHCGKYERIGVRHRESQTLFLSELIDVAACQNPAYAQLHLGLHIAILRDAMDRSGRLTAVQEAMQSESIGCKRLHPGDEVQSSKKRRRIMTRSSTKGKERDKDHGDKPSEAELTSVCALFIYHLFLELNQAHRSWL